MLSVPPPTGPVGFWAAVAVNTIVAVVFWVWPIAVFLVAIVAIGFVALAVSGWRRFGVGLLAGALMVALAGVAWTFVYFVSEGS